MPFMHNLARDCMPFLYFLEGIRCGVLDSFFALITHLGEETFFLAVAIIFFWCINKREGYFIFISPEFHSNYYNFCDRLKKNGINCYS